MMRWIGYFFGATALGVLALDLYRFVDTATYKASTIGATWAIVDIASLNLAQAVVQRYVSAWLWDPAIQTVLLTSPMWLVLAIIGVLFFAVDALRRRGTH